MAVIGYEYRAVIDHKATSHDDPVPWRVSLEYRAVGYDEEWAEASYAYKPTRDDALMWAQEAKESHDFHRPPTEVVEL